MGPLRHLVEHDAWALWLAAPALGIAVVCLAVWWAARPARPASTPRSIAGHDAYLAALIRAPRERVAPPAEPAAVPSSSDVVVVPAATTVAPPAAEETETGETEAGQTEETTGVVTLRS